MAFALQVNLPAGQRPAAWRDARATTGSESLSLEEAQPSENGRPHPHQRGVCTCSAAILAATAAPARACALQVNVPAGQR
ncbi:MAG TPA: hypothetical protein VH599_16430 [Ktedonobacterales bacterium]